MVPWLATVTQAGEPSGIGILGDSYSDEYQFYSPDRSTSRNWAEILSATRGLNFGDFSRTSRGEPRNQGFAYNWARSDATTGDVIATGQHTGLARQVAAGELRYVVVFIGGNDFIHALDGPDPWGEVDRVLPRALANYRTAVETVLAASPDVKLVTATVPDIRNLPGYQEGNREGRMPAALLDRYTEAIGRYNAQIRALALRHPRVALADFDMFTRMANRLSKETTLVLGRKLDRLRSGNDLGHLFLADRRHLGTLGQGFMAQMFVNTLNVKYAAGIPTLTDRELLEFAASLGPDGSSPKALANLGQDSPVETFPRPAGP
jgi:lysophospholipase L1-like esterase